MASPDISSYVDLNLYSKSVNEIVETAVEYAQTVLPEFTPETGSIEDAIVQAVGSMTSELGAAINRMTPGTMEVVLQLLGVTRQSGVRATGTVTITMIDTTGYSIPAGTRFGYQDRTDPLNPVLYAFDTVAVLDIPNGNLTGSVGVSAVFNVQYPPLTAGQTLQLLTPVSSISSVMLSSDLSIGSNPESDAQFFSRATAELASHSVALALPAQFVQYILKTYSDVFRCVAYSLVNPANGSDLVDAPENGYLAIYAAKVGGASLTPTASSAMEDDLEARAVAGLIINVEPPFLVSVPVATTVTILPGYLATVVQENVETALNHYIHPDYWDWSPKIYYNEVVSLIDRVEGVDRVVSLTLNSLTTDYSFTKYGTLPTAVLSVSTL